MQVPHLSYFQNAKPDDPELPRRIAEALRAIAAQSTTTEQQGNLNPHGQPSAPPNIQRVTATGQNGTLHVSIQDQSEGLARGVNYYVEHSAFPDFRDSQVRNIGDSRSHSEFIGNGTRYVRAYSAYPGSPRSAHAYHGSPVSPTAVSGGGSIGPPAYLPSQGSGTGAPGQVGVGPGPLPKRTAESGVQWRGQQPGGPSGLLSTGLSVTPSGNGLSPSGGGGGGGGTPISPPTVLTGTHANRLASYPSVLYPQLAEFFESDRTSWYWVQDASGTVTVTGGVNVAWASGDHFINTGSGFTAAQWPKGTRISVNGVTCFVNAVASPTSLTIQAATTNASGVSYSVASGRWVYLSGMYSDVYASKPSDLGENDYQSGTLANGFKFFAADYSRGFEWVPTGAAPASASPGWGRFPDELPTGFIGILPFGGGQLASGWQLCDGTAGVVITQDDASTTTITVPNFVGAYPKGGAYAPSQIAATVPTIGGNTEPATVGFNPASGAAAATSTPVVVQSGTGTTVNSLSGGGGGGGGGSLVTDPHSHAITSADAPITLPGDPVAHVVAPFYLKR